MEFLLVIQRLVEPLVDSTDGSFDEVLMKESVLAWFHKAINGSRQDRPEAVCNDPVVRVGDGDGTGLECFLASTLLRYEKDVCPVECAVGTLARLQVLDDLQKNWGSDVNQGFVQGEGDAVTTS